MGKCFLYRLPRPKRKIFCIKCCIEGIEVYICSPIGETNVGDQLFEKNFLREIAEIKNVITFADPFAEAGAEME